MEKKCLTGFNFPLICACILLFIIVESPKLSKKFRPQSSFVSENDVSLFVENNDEVPTDKKTLTDLKHSKVETEEGAEQSLSHVGGDDCEALKALSTLFMVVGDWGGRGAKPYRTAISEQVGTLLGEVSNKLKPAFVVSPGDCFYPHGPKKAGDIRFQETFEKQFSAASLQIPWYIAPGNHDYEGKIKQLYLYSKLSKRWHMPRNYYCESFKLTSNRSGRKQHSTADILFLDTNRLVRQFQRMPKYDGEQWNWIKQTLRSSTADWIVAVGHHPVYSEAEHGSYQQLINQLLPLLNQHGAALYFSGHDHSLQHIRPQNSSVDLFVIATGSYSMYSTLFKKTVPPGYVRFHHGGGGRGGFAAVQLSLCHAVVTLYETNPQTKKAEVVYQLKKMNPRHHACCSMS